MIVVLLFFLGCSIMSFLMQFAEIQPLSLQNLLLRSRCRECEHVLSYFDLVPILSYIVLKGQCRYCRSIIRKDLFIAEILGSMIIMIPIMKMTYINTTLFYTIAFILLVLSLQDIRYLIVPHRFLLLLTICLLWSCWPLHLTQSQCYFICILLICSFCFHQYIGMGDFKIILILSFFLPLPFILIMLWITFPCAMLLLPIFHWLRIYTPPYFPLVPAIHLSFLIVSLYYPTFLNMLGGLL